MTVYLVGAGPGDPGLLTARALELIARADVIVHDRLIPESALEGARADADLVYVGKEGGGPSASQTEIERMLVEHGRAGRTVVRLKGGDPFVFGRGGEEAEALKDAGIDFEVVPGVTAGVAAPAYAGIPVTHRDLASSVAFVTGHEDPAKPESALDWSALAAFPGTLVIYMGIRQLGAITERLIAGGRDPAQPAAVVERGTLRDQRVYTGTLETIAQAGARAPAIAVLGSVAALSERLAWRTPATARRAHDRGHPCARAGECAGVPPAGARGGGRGGAGDQDPPTRRPGARGLEIRPLVSDEPQRRTAAVRTARAGRARARRRARRGDRAGNGGRAQRSRRDRRCRAGAVHGGRPPRSAGWSASQACFGRARRRGA